MIDEEGGMNEAYRRWRDSTIRSYRRTLRQLHQAAKQTAAALHGPPETEAEQLRDLQLITEMAIGVSGTIEYLRTGLLPPESESRPRIVTVAEIPPNAHPAVPAGVGDGERLAAVLSCLPRRQREVLVLVEGQGFSLAEAAELLGVSRQTVHIHLQRARQAVAKALSDRGAKPATNERLGLV